MALLGQPVQVRWDEHLVRIFAGLTEVAVHARVAAGQFAPRPGQPPQALISSQQATLDSLLGRASQCGPALHAWADAAVAQRGIRALRLLQGVLALTRTHPRAQVLRAAERAGARAPECSVSALP